MYSRHSKSSSHGGSIHAPRVDGVRMGFQRSFVGECSTRQVLVEDLSTFIQTSPQVCVRWVGLSEQRLRGHGLMRALNNGMISWASLARKAHLYAKCKQPEM